ncbi:MAG: hypothetical protein VYB32_04545 [Pseudomonadota bacterium]|jgi:hypothetical protein|nr:hypothetical protein [Pseudomonadota bacterium]
MLKRFCMVVAASALWTTASAQTAADPAGSQDIIVGAWSDPAKCNSTNALHLSFDAIIKQGPKLNGTCVAVEGFWAVRALFKRASDGNEKKSNSSHSFRGRRIGIYAREQILERAPQRATRSTVVGIVGQCDTEWPDAMMILGYCHYTGGPLIKVSEIVPSLPSSTKH